MKSVDICTGRTSPQIPSPMKWLRFLAISVVLALDDDDEGEDIGGGWKKTVNDQGQRVQQMQVMAPALSEQDQKDARLPEQSAALGLRGTASRISGKLSRKDTGLAALANI